MYLTKLPNITPVEGPAHDLRGHWWNESIAGQGVGIDVIGREDGAQLLFGGFFTYEKSTGRRLWLALHGGLSPGASSHAVSILMAEGGSFNGPPSITATRVGTATVTPTSSTTLLIDLDFDTRTSTRWEDTRLVLSKMGQ
jgi:hypothetical protein